jgi:hypothetical protein
MKLAEYVLTIRPDGAATEAETIRRLRAALKVLLRAFRLRCVSIEAVAGAAGEQRPSMDVVHQEAPA